MALTSSGTMDEAATPPRPAIVKEGWLNKRGEHIKNWRQRYFFLQEDGTLLGFKTKPEHGLEDPLNNFTVKVLKSTKLIYQIVFFVLNPQWKTNLSFTCLKLQAAFGLIDIKLMMQHCLMLIESCLVLILW